MKLLIILAPLALLATAANAQPWRKEIPIEGRWLGSNRCGPWSPGTKLGPEHAAAFNWILGFLSGRARATGKNYLAAVSNEQLWTMVVSKCAAHSGSQLGTIGFEIERELLAKR